MSENMDMLNLSRQEKEGIIYYEKQIFVLQNFSQKHYLK